MPEPKGKDQRAGMRKGAVAAVSAGINCTDCSKYFGRRAMAGVFHPKGSSCRCNYMSASTTFYCSAA